MFYDETTKKRFLILYLGKLHDSLMIPVLSWSLSKDSFIIPEVKRGEAESLGGQESCSDRVVRAQPAIYLPLASY